MSCSDRGGVCAAGTDNNLLENISNIVVILGAYQHNPPLP